MSANPEGYGSPFIKVFSGKRELSYRISKWVLVDSEKGDDRFEFSIFSEDASLRDDPAFEEDAELTVLRGYIGGIQGRARKFYVRVVEPVYNEEGLTMNIKSFDKASKMRENQTLAGHSVDESNKVEEVVEAVANVYKVRPEFIQAPYTAAQMIRNDRDAYLKSLNVFEFEKAVKTLKMDRFEEYYARKLRSGEKTPMTREQLMQKSLKGQVFKYRSDMKSLTSAIQVVAAEKVVVTGHDDKLVIKTEDFDQAPYRVYHWRGGDGELLTFIPESLSRSFRESRGHIKLIFPDKKSKKTVIQSLDQTNSPKTALNDVVTDTSEAEIQEVETFRDIAELPQDGTIQNTGEMLSGLKPFNPMENGINLDGGFTAYRVPNKNNPEEGTIQISNPEKSTVSKRILKKDGTWTTDVDESRSKFKPYLVITQVTTHQEPASVNEQELMAKRDEDIMENGVATIIPDPRVESGMIIGVMGVGKKDSGNYYIIETIETSDNRGYTMELKLKTNAKGKTGTEGPNKTEATNLDKPVNKKAEPDPINYEGERLNNLNPSVPVPEQKPRKHPFGP